MLGPKALMIHKLGKIHENLITKIYFQGKMA